MHNNLSFSGLNLALANPDTDLRIFGKPEGFTRRRIGVATARAETTDQARELAARSCWTGQRSSKLSVVKICGYGS